MRNDFESNYLAHHGILGMKWGIRRYQNPDGSLTSEGKLRYNQDGSKKTFKERREAIKKRKKQMKSLAKARAARNKANAAKQESNDFSKKKEEILRSGDPKQILKYRKYMTDNEMNSALNRIRNEQALKDMVKASEKSGIDKIDGLMKTVGKVQNWAEIGIKTYDTTADLYNTFIAQNEDEKWKKIRSGKKNKKKNKDQDEDND